jgi:hypothetical protein
VPLDLVATQGRQYLYLLRVFDAFGHHPHAKRMDHGDDGLEKSAGFLCPVYLARECTVDLQYIDIQLL